MTGALLEPGVTCATLVEPRRSGLLVDGEAFYRALYQACCGAKRTIVMAGWQFETDVALVRGADAEARARPTTFLAFLRDLCERNPALEVYLLAWDSSPVFAFERLPLQKLRFWWQGHDRIHFQLDNAHPVGSSHHQKLVVIDRAIAFLGGMDVATARWDGREHHAREPRRWRRGRPYGPYHDVQAYVTGPPVDVLRAWFCDRWQRATGSALELPAVEAAEIVIEPTLALAAPRIALARTMPADASPTRPAITELYRLHLRAIAGAERLIYLENQYFSSDELARALVRRMEAGGPPLEIVMVLPAHSEGWKERISIGVYQARCLRALTEAAARTGHRLGVYHTCASGDGELPVFIHAKVLVVDDRFVLVSSANASNRSMTFDSELGIAWEAPAPTAHLRDARLELLREHCGLSAAAAAEVLGPIDGLVARLDDLARARQHRLRLHQRNRDERPGWPLSWLLPDGSPFDPDHSMIEELLPEPAPNLDRWLRDPLVLLGRGGRRLGRRLVAALGGR